MEKVGQVRGGMCLYLIVAFDHFPLPFSNLVFCCFFPSGEDRVGEWPVCFLKGKFGRGSDLSGDFSAEERKFPLASSMAARTRVLKTL